jgi:hypothetical protein
MSIAHSSAWKDGKWQNQGQEGWQTAKSLKSSKQLRRLDQPSGYPATVDTNVIHLNGNTKPQEPSFLQRRPSGSRQPPRMSGNIHDKPWSISIAPGKKENPHHTNPYHRVWIHDAGLIGMPYDGQAADRGLDKPRRWNERQKKEYYEKYYRELNSRKPHDEVFAVKSNLKYWTHLKDQGMNAGGQQEKLDPIADKKSKDGYSYGHLYKGKFSNIKHAQLIIQSGRKVQRKNGQREPEEWVVDTRTAFDNRLKDDMIRFDDDRDRDLANRNYEMYRPKNTRSCPQLGAEFMNR